mmetsp:Transcript_45794/g.147020  ORF Transcript_45794/g.147020 Transcript_45794/m.147020 type:complete len:332 (+) Transcript_45794:2650-3645(+)
MRRRGRQHGERALTGDLPDVAHEAGEAEEAQVNGRHEVHVQGLLDASDLAQELGEVVGQDVLGDLELPHHGRQVHLRGVLLELPLQAHLQGRQQLRAVHHGLLTGDAEVLRGPSGVLRHRLLSHAHPLEVNFEGAQDGDDLGSLLHCLGGCPPMLLLELHIQLVRLSDLAGTLLDGGAEVVLEADGCLDALAEHPALLLHGVQEPRRVRLCGALLALLPSGHLLPQGLRVLLVRPQHPDAEVGEGRRQRPLAVLRLRENGAEVDVHTTRAERVDLMFDLGHHLDGPLVVHHLAHIVEQRLAGLRQFIVHLHPVIRQVPSHTHLEHVQGLPC